MAEWSPTSPDYNWHNWPLDWRYDTGIYKLPPGFWAGNDYLADLDSITVLDLENSIRKYLALNNAVISVLVPEA